MHHEAKKSEQRQSRREPSTKALGLLKMKKWVGETVKHAEKIRFELRLTSFIKII